jgi:hypothetical protein
MCKKRSQERISPSAAVLWALAQPVLLQQMQMPREDSPVVRFGYFLRRMVYDTCMVFYRRGMRWRQCLREEPRLSTQSHKPGRNFLKNGVVRSCRTIHLSFDIDTSWDKYLGSYCVHLDYATNASSNRTLLSLSLPTCVTYHNLQAHQTTIRAAVFKQV